MTRAAPSRVPTSSSALGQRGRRRDRRDRRRLSPATPARGRCRPGLHQVLTSECLLLAPSTAAGCRCSHSTSLAVSARDRLAAGGKEIRTVGPAVKEKPFRRAVWLLFARTCRTSGLADETGTSPTRHRAADARSPKAGEASCASPGLLSRLSSHVSGITRRGLRLV